MTVHSAKGLEFHSVFLSGLEEGLFPHDNSRNEAGGLEEERRLMYVAYPGAARLYLSFAQSRMLHGQTRYNIPSRFLQEIPDSLLKWLQPVQKTAIRNQEWGIRNQEPVRVTPGYAYGAQTGTSSIRDSAASQWR